MQKAGLHLLVFNKQNWICTRSFFLFVRLAQLYLISSWAIFRFDNTDNVSILKIQNHNHNSKSKNQLLFLPYLQRVNFLSGAFVSVTFFFKWTEILTFIILFIIELSMVKTQNRRKRPCPHDDSINHKNYTFLVSRCVIGFERSCIFY